MNDGSRTPSALVLYHYFHPDDVVSAQHFGDLCRDLTARGWAVTAMPSNRGCRNESQVFPEREMWEGISIERVWRPKFRQASFFGRLANALWMIFAWSFAALRHKPDVLFVGTDPIFSVLCAIPWKWLRPHTRIVHWCFDLHPEAAVAAGMFRADSFPVRLLKPFLRQAYRNCSIVGSIGPCMTARLRSYDPGLPIGIYTPWALAEAPSVIPTDPDERASVFGDAKLTLMYSGSFGHAHDYEHILALARKLRHHPDIRFAFSVRGNREKELRNAVTEEDSNISFPGFAPLERLEQRLSAADVHVVSLRSGYEGTVVPSKFQGALAAGRPILYSGPSASAVASWIDEHGLGWNLREDNLDAVAADLIKLKDDPDRLGRLNRTCFDTYHARFSRASVIELLDRDMRALL